jgi:hypothetical protein
MVAHVVKKFLTSVRVLSTMYFQILVHLEPINSILKWKQHVPPESLCHHTALHGVQTQKAAIWRNLFRSSLFWGVTQSRLIASSQCFGKTYRFYLQETSICNLQDSLHTKFHYHSYECVLPGTERQHECIPRCHHCFWEHFSNHLPMYAIIPQMEPLLQVFQQKVYAHFLSPMLMSVSVFWLYLLYACIETAVAFML